MARRISITLACILAIVIAGLWALGSGWLGRHEAPGEITAIERPASEKRLRAQSQAGASRDVGLADADQILFGDLHVHTTFSTDAFLFSLPVLGGEGTHPPADACDFARFCSALDFWSINDHAESLTPTHWRETVESIRQCNAVAGDSANPDVVAFLGWEWTQVGGSPSDHYGHKNIVLAHTDDERIPARPIASIRAGRELAAPGPIARIAMAGILRDRRSLDLTRYFAERAARETCPHGVPVRDLPPDCTEAAATPAELFEKLDDWGHSALVIPHGTAWGWSAQRGSDWALQLSPEQDDADRQSLVEVFSGHGNSEEYRDWRAVEIDDQGRVSCPEPRADYLPACWRAGQIIRERCRAAGESEQECDARAADARANHVAGGRSGLLTVPGARPEDWLDAGQCRDCFLPDFDLRPRMSVQYMLARSNFEAMDAGGQPYRQRMGFIASSDIHSARPGTGYKEVARSAMTDARGQVGPTRFPGLSRDSLAPEPRSIPLDELPPGARGTGFGARDYERVSSYLYTGGLVAAHARGRSREAVFEALEDRHVYGTSGDRILLYFDLLNPPAGERGSMGSEHEMQETPRFEVRAVGAFEQKPGCPEHVTSALSPERVARLCAGECYNPSDRRRRITRIEVVRIRPQVRPDEPVADLIEDPWLQIPCPGDPAGCVFQFEDSGFTEAGRATTYYVRAIQEPTPVLNADGVRCQKDEAGGCVRSSPCYADARAPQDTDCLAPEEQRAWSSPIWLDWGG